MTCTGLDVERPAVGRDSGLEVTDVAVDPMVLSDHLPVVAELALVGA